MGTVSSVRMSGGISLSWEGRSPRHTGLRPELCLFVEESLPGRQVSPCRWVGLQVSQSFPCTTRNFTRGLVLGSFTYECVTPTLDCFGLPPVKLGSWYLQATGISSVNVESLTSVSFRRTRVSIQLFFYKCYLYIKRNFSVPNVHLTDYRKLKFQMCCTDGRCHDYCYVPVNFFRYGFILREVKVSSFCFSGERGDKHLFFE